MTRGRYAPTDGLLTNDEDKRTIRDLTEKARSGVDDEPVGYTGERSLAGMRHGRGIETFADGGVYDGEWRHDRRCGHGVYTWQWGDKYDGTWEDDVMHGDNVVHTFADGGVYRGAMRKGKREGRGHFFYSNGAELAATYHADLKVKGLWLCADGEARAVRWELREADAHASLSGVPHIRCVHLPTSPHISP